MFWTPNIQAVLCVHRAVFALELGVAERDDIAGPDLIVLRDARVGDVGVYQGTVGARADREQRCGHGAEDFQDHGLRTPVAEGRVVFRCRCGRDGVSEFAVGAFQLLLAEGVGR